MLALAVTCLVTADVNAESFVADDTYVMSSQYHDFFKNYFGEDKSYQYFSYKCDSGNYQRNCYYGIDSEGNSVKITYVDNGSYNYNYSITSGVDEDFSVTGVSVFKVKANPNYLTNFVLIFSICLVILLIFLGGL